MSKFVHDFKDIDVTIYDAAEAGALLHVDWSQFSLDGPLFLRCNLVPYDKERLIWLAYAAGRPIVCDLSQGTISVGGVAFYTNLRALEAFVK